MKHKRDYETVVKFGDIICGIRFLPAGGAAGTTGKSSRLRLVGVAKFKQDRNSHAKGIGKFANVF